MERRRARSGDVSQTLVAAAEDAPRDADLAFEELYRSSRDDVHAYVTGLLRDRSAAEDVTAAAFERAYRKRSRFNPARGTPRAWLFGIARNAALDELRRRSRLAAMTAEPPDDSPSPEDVAEGRLRRTAVRAAFERLAPRDRELIALKFFAGLSNTEIAAVLGVSESNAGTRLHRTITKLREACHETA
jgi:RNA polymerase sigma-70 factor, ECF subfamily